MVWISSVWPQGNKDRTYRNTSKHGMQINTKEKTNLETKVTHCADKAVNERVGGDVTRRGGRRGVRAG